VVRRSKFRDQGAASDPFKHVRAQHQHDNLLDWIPMTPNNLYAGRQVDDPRTLFTGEAMENVSPIQQEAFQPISTGSAVPAFLAAGPSWPSLAVDARVAALEPAAIALRRGFIQRLVD
jgi:hypothetical protein